MKLEIKNLEIDGDKVKVVTEFIGSMEGLCSGRYSYDSVVQMIQSSVSQEVPRTILKEKSAEIIEKIDIEELIKRIKLETIDSLLGRDRR